MIITLCNLKKMFCHILHCPFCCWLFDSKPLRIDRLGQRELIFLLSIITRYYVVSDLKGVFFSLASAITQTCPCNILQYFTAVKMLIFG